MKVEIIAILSKIGSFLAVGRNRYIVLLSIVSILALGDFLLSGLTRRTLVFFSNIGDHALVEDRMLRRSGDRETDIRRYVNQVLLGPANPRSNPLFPRETRINTFMLRDGVVFVDLTEDAAIPLNMEAGVFRSFLTLNEGIRRNFSYVNDVRLFIGGNAVFFEEFRWFFANSADNYKTSP